MPAFALLAAAALACTATDGDTLRCAPPGQGQESERVRLIGIDAPELPGHCARWRSCAPGDPWASQAALARLLRGGPISLDRHGTDHYGRTLAFVFVGGVNLSCAQLRAGQAVYVERWDIRGRLARCYSQAIPSPSRSSRAAYPGSPRRIRE